MAKFFPELTGDQQAFIAAQKIFFVASAPDEGRVNVSLKGQDCLRVLGPRRIAYLDLTGSGNETAAHILDNGRVTLMWCHFEGDPLILRIYGRGQVVRQRHPEWAALIARFPPLPGTRQIIAVDIDSVQTSCGFAVPLFNYQGERQLLINWAEKKGEQGLADYWRERNSKSIDGLPTPMAPPTGE